MEKHELTTWIEELRGRLDRGELRDNPDIEAFASSSLLRIDSWWATPLTERVLPESVQQQHQLAEELAGLHAHLIEGAPWRPRSRQA
jgi:hypothetical protein